MEQAGLAWPRAAEVPPAGPALSVPTAVRPTGSFSVDSRVICTEMSLFLSKLHASRVFAHVWSQPGPVGEKQGTAGAQSWLQLHQKRWRHCRFWRSLLAGVDVPWTPGLCLSFIRSCSGVG